MTESISRKYILYHRKIESVVTQIIKRMLIFFLVFVFCFHAAVAFAWTKSGTIYTTNGSQSDVAAAVSAASIGDTVSIPSGVFVWATGININKKINIIGTTSGCPSSCNDATKIIIGDITAFTSTATGFRVSGITFEGISNSNGVIFINAGGTNRATDWRVDHNHFKDVTGRSISVGASASVSGYGQDFPGLIDSNFFSGTNQNKVVQVYGGSLTAHGSWDSPLDLGGSNFLFFENNKVVFTNQTIGTSGLDSDTGGRFVVRYNDFTNFWISAHGMETIANPAGLPWKSTHAFEIYHNTFSGTSNDFLIYLRGGTGVIWNNTFNETVPNGNPIWYLYERGDSTRTCLNAGACQGSNAYDGNQAGKYGYICYAQIGATGNNGITPSPLYQWGNTYLGSSDEYKFTGVNYESGCNYQHVQIGRDIIINGSTPKPGYTPYSYPHPLTTAGTSPPPPEGKIPKYPPINPIQ